MNPYRKPAVVVDADPSSEPKPIENTIGAIWSTLYLADTDNWPLISLQGQYPGIDISMTLRGVCLKEGDNVEHVDGSLASDLYPHIIAACERLMELKRLRESPRFAGKLRKIARRKFR